MIRKQTEPNKEIKKIERKQERDNLIDENIDLGIFFKLASSDQKHVCRLNFHEVDTEFLLVYKGDFGVDGLMVVAPVQHKTNFRFKNMDEFETYINAIDVDYDSEDVTFTGYVYKLNTPQFNRVKRSQYGRGTDFGEDIVEYIGNNCYIPSSGNCFIKCINYFTKKDYTQEFSIFIRTEKYRSEKRTSATYKPFCRKKNINIGCF